MNDIDPIATIGQRPQYALWNDEGLRLGVSACVLGEPVRYDRGHKRSAFVTDVLARHFELMAFCPETEAGLGLPRPTIRQRMSGDRLEVVGVKDPSLNVTEPLSQWCEGNVQRSHGLSGFVLQKGSPSCGMARVKVYGENGHLLHSKGQGLFATALARHDPDLPIEEDGRLNDLGLRENFLNRVYLYAALKRLQQVGLTAASLLDFHSRCKMTLLAHNPEAYKRMGQDLSNLRGVDLNALFPQYRHRLMQALALPAKRERHVNALQHLAGYLKDIADAHDRAEMSVLIEAYRRAEVPRIVPIILLRHHLRRHPDDYALKQHYLWSYPDDLALGNR